MTTRHSSTLRPLFATCVAAALATTCLVLEGCQNIKDRAGSTLMAQFADLCPTNGRWTELAMKQNQALQDTLEELKKTDPCKPFEGTLNTLSLMSKTVGTSLGDPQLQSLRNQQNQVADLAMTIDKMPANAPAGARAPLLASALTKTQEMALASSEINSTYGWGMLNSDVARKKLSELDQGLGSMISSAGTGLQQCLLQQPRAAFQLATQLLAITSSSVSPESAGAIQAISSLLGTAFMFRGDTAVIEREQYRMQEEKLPQGLSCALEAMTEAYCGAVDAEQQLDFRSKHTYKKDGDLIEPLGRGMDILTRRMPALTDLLTQLRFGNAPSDEHDAKRKTDAWDKVISLIMVNNEVQGKIRKVSRMIEGSSDSAMTKSYLSSLILDLCQYIERADTPVSEFIKDPRKLACMLILSPDLNFQGCNIPDIGNVDTYMRNNNLVARTDLTMIQRNWAAIYDLTNKRVTNEFAKQVNIDPKATIFSMTVPSANNISAMQTLQYIVSYLDQVLQQESRYGRVVNGTADLIADTRARIVNVINAVIDHKFPANFKAPDTLYAVTNGADDERDREILGFIFDQFQLKIGIQFIPDRIRQIVEWELQGRMQRGELPDNVAGILVAMGGSITDSLGIYASNADRLKLDISGGRSLTQGNLQRFLSFFNDPLNDTGLKSALQRAIEILRDRAERAREKMTGPDRPNYDKLAQLCILALSSYDTIPDTSGLGLSGPSSASRQQEALLEGCRGVVLQSVYADQATPAEATNAEIGNLPLTLSYDQLVNVFDGAYANDDNWKELRGRHPYLTAPLAHPPTASAPPPASPAQDVYSQIFHNSVLAPLDRGRNLTYADKVCTYHRFFRASRVMEALPRLDPEFVKALERKL